MKCVQQMSWYFNDVYEKGSDYHCIISLISKNQTIKLMQNADLTERGEH